MIIKKIYKELVMIRKELSTIRRSLEPFPGRNADVNNLVEEFKRKVEEELKNSKYDY